jgi:hypothetical protein
MINVFYSCRRFSSTSPRSEHFLLAFSRGYDAVSHAVTPGPSPTVKTRRKED